MTNRERKVLLSNSEEIYLNPTIKKYFPREDLNIEWKYLKARDNLEFKMETLLRKNNINIKKPIDDLLPEGCTEHWDGYGLCVKEKRLFLIKSYSNIENLLSYPSHASKNLENVNKALSSIKYHLGLRVGIDDLRGIFFRYVEKIIYGFFLNHYRTDYTPYLIYVFFYKKKDESQQTDFSTMEEWKCALKLFKECLGITRGYKNNPKVSKVNIIEIFIDVDKPGIEVL